MCVALVCDQELENFITGHTKPTTQYVLQVLVEHLDFLGIAILHLTNHAIIKVFNGRMYHLFDLVLVSLRSALAHLRQQLVLAVLRQSFQLVRQILSVKVYFVAPV